MIRRIRVIGRGRIRVIGRVRMIRRSGLHTVIMIRGRRDLS